MNAGKLLNLYGGPYGTIFATFSCHHLQKCSVSSSSCEVSHNGEKIDRTWVVNHHSSKNLTICLFESCSHREYWPILHSSRFVTVASPYCAVHSGHKLDTTFSLRFGSLFVIIQLSILNMALRICLRCSDHKFVSVAGADSNSSKAFDMVQEFCFELQFGFFLA